MLFDAIQGGFSSFDFRSFIIQLLLSVPPFLLALSVHEAAHGWVANRCGDPTARLLGRVTLNPIAHIDPVGFAMLFIVGFGWAKPVPVNPNNFRNYRKDDIKVSLAGITANFLMFVIGLVGLYAMVAVALGRIPGGAPSDAVISQSFKYAGAMGSYLIEPLLGSIPGYLYEMVLIFTTINLVLAVFNLIPVPPLDGYHVLNDLILKRSLFAPQRAAMVGQILLIVLLMSGAIGRVLGAVVNGALAGAGTVFEALFRALHLV